MAQLNKGVEKNFLWYRFHLRYLRPALLKMAAIYEDVLPESKQRYTAKAKKYFNDWLDKGKP